MIEDFIKKLQISSQTKDDIEELMLYLYNLNAPELYQQIGVCQESLRSLYNLIKQRWTIERELELMLIGLQTKTKEGYSSRNAYNNGYKDGKNGRFERKEKHPTNFKTK